MSSRSATATPTGVAVCFALLSAVVHLVIAPEHLAETLYIGILFIAGGVALLLTAGALALWNSVTAWWAGALVSGGMILGFALSRTIGLPGYHEQGWDPPYGVLSITAEGMYLVAFFAWYGTRSAHASSARVPQEGPRGQMTWPQEPKVLSVGAAKGRDRLGPWMRWRDRERM
ncbi:hypothetical protein [Streptomyces longhuiensis]|uniref:hypothetical protein n=1 Tax=Streptomyces TaxID=1883 RepID=UPI001D0ABFB8|nr:hypothetical protein [Streptomyces longhuiensis]UDM04715.1 hypothetical protein LGI35_44040 [Streptomyces longhuiensis]